MRHDKSELDRLLQDLDDDIDWDESRQKRLGNKIQSTLNKRQQRLKRWKKSFKYVSSTAGVIALLFLGFQFFSSIPNYKSSDEAADSGSPQADYDTSENSGQDTSGNDSGSYDGAEGEEATNNAAEESNSDGESSHEEPREEMENQSDLEQRIIMQQRIGDGQLNAYENINNIRNNQTVEQVKEIMEQISWEKVEVDMNRPADYRFYYEYENTDMATKAIMHNIWVSDNGDQLVIVRDPDEYAVLTKQMSKILFHVLTGEELMVE
ncbi:hypothetical protein [Radiobacillus sp. PE A8.2]|uniref:hypothetical protein n=1 Tax=Radiobacillus sp. PE A8.2 TaxID=3380349 RepID=UPI00388F0435